MARSYQTRVVRPHIQQSAKASLPKETTMQTPSVDASDYDGPAVLVEDAPDATPKHGTSVQAGWGAADALLKPKTSDYPQDLKFSESVQLIRFLDDGPFKVYQQHWIEREGKKSFVCLETEAEYKGTPEACPLCSVVGDKPRGKLAFNVLVCTEEVPVVKILTASPQLANQLRAINDDPRLGTLSKHYRAISRHGTGPLTSYSIDRVMARDLAEEWDLDADNLEGVAASVTKYDASSVYVTPRAELLEIARALV